MEKMQIRLENWYIMLITLFVINIGYTQTQRIYTTSGTFTPPAGVSTIQVDAYGAGGGGGYGGTSNKDGGGGGGGGGFSKNTSISVSAGTTYTITIGTLGLGSTSSVSPNGGNGGNTTATFGSTTITANGGIGGFGYSNGGAGGTGGTGSTFNGGAGGAGLNGQGSGGGGGAAGTSGNGGIGSVPTGGSAGGGNAGAGGNGTTSPSGAGSSSLTNYGGGGGGGTKNSSGGNGANGYMIITYTCPTYSLTNATTSNSPICVGSSALVNLNSSNLGTGTYTVTFTLSGATNSIGNTSTMNFVAGNPGSGTFSTPILNIGVTNITITNLSSSNCSNSISSFNTTSVTVNLPSTANAGNSITACSSDTLIPITSGASATNYTSIAWTSNGTGTFTNANSLTSCTYTPSAADIAAENITLTLTAISPGCSNAISNKNLSLVPAPTVNAGIQINTCSTNGAVNITAGSSASNYTSLVWTSNGTGTFTNPNSLTNCTYTPSAADISVGTVILTLTASGDVPCSNTSATKNLIINQPMVVNAGANFSSCYSSTGINISSDATSSNYTSVSWTSNGTGTFTNSNSLNNCSYTPSAADIMIGNVIFTLTTSNVGCSDEASSKTVSFSSSPTSNAGTVINTCSTSGAINITAGSSATNYTSLSWTSNGTGTFANANSLTNCTYTPSAADISAGTVTLTLTANGNAPCSSVTSTKNLIISQPMVANAGVNFSACYTSGNIDISTDASASNYINVSWTSNGTGILNNANSLNNCSYTPSATDITNGNVTFTLTTSNAGCPNVVSSKTVSFISAPTSNAGTVINTCSSAGAVNITTGSSATNYTSVTWSSNGTGTFTNPNSLTNCTYTPSAADNSTGTIILTLTVNGNAPCGSVTSTKNLIITQPLVVFAGADFTVCYSSGSINMATDASASNYTSVTWTSSGTGSFVNANSLNNCSYTPSAADLSAGNVTFYLTVSNPGCSQATSTKILTIKSLPTSVAGTNVNTCSTNGAVNITTGSSATNYTSILWTSNGTGTLANANSLTNCTYTPSAADISAGTVSLTLTANGNAPCTSVSSTKNLIINLGPTAIAGSNFSSCYSTGAINITSGSSATNQTSVTWTSDGSGVFTNPNSLTTCTYTPSAADIANGSVTFTLTASNAGCSDTTSTKILTISSQPTSVAGSTINTCSTNGAVNITTGSSASNYNSVTWTSSGSGTFSNVNSLTACTYTPSAADISAGTVSLTLTANGNAPCASATSTKNLIISQTMTAVAGASFTECSSNTSINVTSGASATNQSIITWSSDGTGTFTNENSLTTCTYTPSAADIAAGSVLITLTASNSSCPDVISTKTLSFVTAPIVDAGSDIATCSTCGTVNITANSSASNYTSIVWTSSGTGTFANANSLTACTYTPSAADITTSLTQGGITLTLTATGTSPCTTTIATKVLAITSQTFTSSGTFTVPAGVYQVTVEAWGGGGKGGDGLNIGNVGGGGGGGAYSAKSIPVIPGNTYTVNVGLGATTVSDGGDSWFINQSTFLAKGGKTALNNATVGAAGGSATSSIGDVTSRGGNGANGLSGSYGGGGGAGAEAGENMGVDAVTSLGAIAVCSGGNGGNGYTNPNGDGSPGIAPGGGGGGGRRNGNNGVNQGTGGRGADGKVIIKWPVNALPSTLTNGPGGVTSDLQLWLRSDLLNGTTTVADNTPITTWYTQAKGANAIKPAAVGAPIYRNNANYNINFNAVVDFTNPYNSPSQVYTDLSSSRQYLKGTNGYYSEDTFVVVIPDVTVTSSLNSMDVFGGKSSPCAQNAKSGISYGNVDTRFTNEVLSYTSGTSTSYGTAQVSTTTQYNSPGIINIRNNSGNTGMQLYYNSNNIATTEVNTSKHRNIYDSQYWIGRSETWDGSLDGRVAEVITFSSRKNDATERTKIESYLGIKYGITLGVNGTSQNYLASDGTIIWNASTNAGFNNDIAGIGRDDASKLNQKQSKSVNANSIVTIGLGTVATTNTANTNVFDTDKKYLVWGDNGANMNNSGTPVIFTFGGTSGVTTSTEVLNRKWKIVETGGDVATTKVSVLTSALANLPALSGNDAYVMVIASDASFTTGLEMTFLKTNSTKQETDYDFDGTKYFTFGIAHESKYTRHATFDGTSNIMKMEAVNNLSSPFTMMTWVRPTGANSLSNDRTIVSKFNGTTGYRVFLSSNNKVNVSWSGGTTLTSNTVLPNNEWHNVTIIYSSGSIKLYIDGVLDSTVASTAPASNTNYMSIGAEYRTKSDTRNYFKGDIDEFRLWNKALSITEVRFIMNQEILQDGSVTKGTIIPNTITKNDIGTLNWSNLQAYYSMNSFIGTHINDDSLSKNRGNVFLPTKTTITIQSSPQPYESASNGSWFTASSWLNGAIQQMPYSLSIVNNSTPISWNIVKTNHNMDSSGNKVFLGLFVNSNTISATNDTKVEVSHYLKLDGKIDLVGKSQLVQTINSDLDVTSAGSIERDQQGQSNKFNYNYWSSPVSSINNSTINHGYTVAGVMKDGTNPNNIQNLLWTTGINSIATSPITLSSYWIFKFQNLSNSYANWSSVGQNGSLLAGQGYTLKGSNALTSNQNYTFVGKPNNGTINSNVAANNLNLSGNPYASAIDADKFIDDNISSITGTLYFWEHYNTNTSHNTVAYQGGYATYTKTGGTAPVAPAGISGLGSSSKVAKRFIPVGQGFFVTGSATGGTITFNNAQRSFVKEDNSTSFSLFRTDNALATVDVANSNIEDDFVVEQFMKIRLGYNSADNYHRQILLGFMNDNATSGYDNGYDALSIETLSNDMYFLNGTNKLNISGEGYFNVDNIYPLGVKNAVAGNVTFMVDQKINMDENQEVYIFDNVTNTYNSIKDQYFQINLPAGTYENRFSLRFTDGSSSLGTNDNEQISEIVVSNSIVNNTINVKNNSLESTVKSVLVFNMIGQQVKTWNVENQDQNNIEFSTKGMSTGTYIVKVITDNGNISKKILIK